MAEQMDYGIETRSRSRSKTPLRVEGVATSKAKTPNVHTILEESETTTTMTSTTPARTSKRMKEARVVLSSVSESVVTSTPSSMKKTANTKTAPIETRQNQKNLLLETSIEAIRKGAASPNGSGAADNVAYQEYKQAGEYWNKTPKTDYTYSELSPHRREIAPNTIAMPNMSRGSLEKHHNRVNAMISRSPEQASYIRQRYGAPIAKPRLDYDSSDDLDYTKYTKNQYNTSIKSTRTHRFIQTITTIFTYIFTSITSIFEVRDRRESMYYTRIEQPGVFKRAFQRLINLWISIMKVFYIVISSILAFDTWILVSRSSKLQGERKRRFLLIIFFLLPLLLLGAYLTSNLSSSSIAILPSSLPVLSVTPLITYIRNITWPLPSMPELPSLPELSLPALPQMSMPSLPTLPSWFTTSTTTSQQRLAASGLDEANIKLILSHIDTYVDKLLVEKLKSSQKDTIDTVLRNEHFLTVVKSKIRENTITESYVLTDADIQRISTRVLESLELDNLKKDLLTQIPHIDVITEEILKSHELKLVIDAQLPNVDELRTSNSDLLIELNRLKERCKSVEDKLSLNFDELRIRIESLEGANDLDGKVRSILLKLFALDETEDVLAWIKSVFITKDYLEERLLRLNLDRDAKIQATLATLSASLMQNVTTHIHRQLEIRHVTVTDDALIRRIVKEVLAVYDADKTALPDYALETAGGQVISTKCTQVYQTKTARISVFGIPLWYQTSTPRVAITPSVHPGQCWAFTGFPGYLVVQLGRLIHVTGFTIEHIPKTLAPNGKIDSAPKNFVVMGLLDENDKNPSPFGSYEFNENGEPLQYFQVQNETVTWPHQFVELRIDSNQGNHNYTCLYRFRVHGLPAE